jgi:hypothetical protein
MSTTAMACHSVRPARRTNPPQREVKVGDVGAEPDPEQFPRLAVTFLFRHEIDPADLDTSGDVP